MSFLRRLYRGETRIGFIKHRKRWYAASAVIILLCVGSMVFRGFNFGIEFKGGSQFITQSVKPGTDIGEVRKAVEATGVEVASAQVRGSNDNEKYVIRTPELTKDQTAAVEKAIVESAKIDKSELSGSEVSSSWGKAVTQQALYALIAFLIAIVAYLWLRYERKMAVAALLALVHDLLLTAGVYSLVGFEVSPSTVVGLLTILGYSLYDTVVVFDKVDENAKGILGHNRYSYPDAANLAVNQTLMRSINTSLIALLPVSGLLFVGAGILGIGTLKDLALVLFVGMLTGAYSSLFLATPWLVDFKMLDSRFKNHAQRVEARQAALAKGEDPDAKARRARAARSKGAKVGAVVAEPAEPVGGAIAVAEAAKPKPGAKAAPGRRTGPAKAGAKGGRRR